MTENEPAHTTTTASSEMCARAFTAPVNARGGCIVRSQRPAARDTSSVFQNLGAFVAVSVVVICTPGQDTALTIRNTLAGGDERRRDRGRRLARPGGLDGRGERRVVALLTASEPVFRTLKLVGAAYLVYLGAQSLWAAIARRRTSTPCVRAFRSRPRARCGRAFSNLGNPKMAVFFASLLPQFAPQDASFAVLLALGFLFCAMTFVWLTFYAVAVARLGRLLTARCDGRWTRSRASCWSPSGSAWRPSASARARSGVRPRGAPCSSSRPRPDRPRRARRRRSGSRGRRGSGTRGSRARC